MKLRLLLKNKTAIYAQLFFVLVMLWLRDVLHFPSAISYVTDVLLLFLLFTSIYKKTNFNILKILLPQYVIVLTIIICMIFGAVLNFVEPLLVLWGLRNNLRFYLFFFICANLLDISDVDFLIGAFKKFFWANVLMCTVQYFFFGLKNDYLGGFFGTERGCNAYLNVFLCIVSAIIIADFYTGKIKGQKLLLYLAATVYLAIIAELKVFYIELIIIAIFTVLLLKPSLKTVAVSMSFLVVLVAGFIALYIYDSHSLYILMDSDALEYYIAGSGYTGGGDLNRFTALGQIQSTFFGNDIMLSLFGFGLGSCEYSQFSFLQSDFSILYGDLNYRWFTHAWVFLEQGMVGILLVLAFFVSLLIYAIRRIRSENKYYMIIAVAFVPTCILGLMYNSAIQIEVCYLIAFMCAIPYIASKKSKDENYDALANEQDGGLKNE